MGQPPTPSITIHDRINESNADAWAARIRSLLRNGHTELTLELGPGSELVSATFIGFLAATATHLRARGGGLQVTGTNPRAQAVLSLAGLQVNAGGTE
ncbi:MAG: STAS domain-containing protein [Planctomycetota bacterium]